MPSVYFTRFYTATAERKLPFLVSYTCYKCDADNQDVMLIPVQASESSTLTSNGLKESAKGKLDRRTKSILSDLKNQKYHSAQFTCQCKKLWL